MKFFAVECAGLLIQQAFHFTVQLVFLVLKVTLDIFSLKLGLRPWPAGGAAGAGEAAGPVLIYLQPGKSKNRYEQNGEVND